MEETWQANGKVEEFAVMGTWLPGARGRLEQEYAASKLGMTVGEELRYLLESVAC
jgi:hypothetical protein